MRDLKEMMKIEKERVHCPLKRESLALGSLAKPVRKERKGEGDVGMT
jgi:hypothetical protein